MAEKKEKLYIELGTTGLKKQAGIIQETYLRELRGSEGQKVRTRMANTDPTIGAILFVIAQIIRAATWETHEKGDEKVDKEAAEFVEGCRNDMSHSWASLISEIQSMLVQGWELNEICWKLRQGLQDPDDPKAPPSSKYNDGLTGIRKLPIRAQDTLFRWEFDESGGLQGMWQSAAPYYAPILIPISKSLLFRTVDWKGNPEGRSILDSAYSPWYSGTHLTEILLVGVERDLNGYPVIRLPAKILMDPDKSAIKTEYETLIKNIRRDEQEGALLPYDPANPEAYKIELLSTGSRRAFNVLEILQYFDAKKAQVVLADFVLMGHEKVGTYALFKGKGTIFETAVLGWLDSMKGVFNSHLVPRLMALNAHAFPGLEELPEITYTMPKVPTQEEVTETIKALSTAGADLFPNAELMNAVLDRVGLPEISEEELEKMSAGMDWFEK